MLDANTGQNALAQVRAFDAAVGLTGLILTKLDGSAKGGIVAAIARQHPIPLKFIGVGEGWTTCGRSAPMSSSTRCCRPRIRRVPTLARHRWPSRRASAHLRASCTGNRMQNRTPKSAVHYKDPHAVDRGACNTRLN